MYLFSDPLGSQAASLIKSGAPLAQPIPFIHARVTYVH